MATCSHCPADTPPDQQGRLVAWPTGTISHWNSIRFEKANISAQSPSPEPKPGRFDCAPRRYMMPIQPFLVASKPGSM